MKNLLLVIALALPALSFAGDLEGYYCANGESTLAFIPTSQKNNTGVIVLKLANGSVTVVKNAQKFWSGSMFVTNGDGLTVQGPGNGLDGIRVLNQDGSINESGTFVYSTQCRTL